MVMLNILTGLVSWGNDIGSILQEWADMGIFAYGLPFLLIFALVFGILWKSQVLGENKGVIVVIALAVGLMSLQFEFVPSFFATIFPYAGVGMAVLLVVLILMGLFVKGHDFEKWYMLAFYVIGGIVALIVILSALGSYEWFGSYWWNEYWPAIITLLVVGGLIAAIVAGSKKSS